MQEIEFYFGTGKKWLFDLIEAIQEKIGSKLVVTSNNNIITWSTKYREGKAEFIELEEGLGLVRADYMLNETLTFKHIPSKSNDYFFIHFSISLHQPNIHTSGEIIEMGNNFANAIVYMSSAISFNIVFPKGEKIRTIIVTVSRNWMLNKISSLNISTKAPLPDYQENKPFQGAFNLDLNCYNIAQELLDTYYWDPSHTLYIKGTVINLLAIFFNNFSNTLGKEERLFLNDAEKIKKQIELLHENLHEPWPDLKTIGVNCNMGKSKFMSLFAKIYGINYYSYYLQVRMQNAYNLLLNGLSVSEAGRSVGYTNLGHFSKVYKEHFGVSPSLIS